MSSIRLTELFTKTQKQAPADETARNAQLLIQTGYIHKEMAGVYAFLPLGLMVLENIKDIVREEMNAIGGQELIMTSLQSKEVWQKTDRWDDKKVDVWFKSKLANGTDVGFGWSHEEPIVQMMKNHVASYKDLPANVYQFQTKLRNELRAKSGIMRGREFVMKDMYSASLDEKQHEDFYQKTIDAYHKAYKRLGIGDETFLTFASGGAFTEFSHEFQTVCDAGEDTVYLHRGKKIAINEEVLNEKVLGQLGVKKDELEEVKTAEVGNIFNFGTVKSEQMDFAYTNEKGEKQFVHLGSYGIGITRVMGVIAEKYSDEKGLVWPENIAPAKVYLARVGDDEAVVKQADELYAELQAADVDVLYDDRDERPGKKFADADLLGIPYRVVVSPKTIESNTLELKKRTEDSPEQISQSELIKRLAVSS